MLCIMSDPYRSRTSSDARGSDYHAQALGLSDRQKLEASECYRLLEGQNASLLEAVHHFLQYREHAKPSVPLRELFKEFLSIKQQDNERRCSRDPAQPVAFLLESASRPPA